MRIFLDANLLFSAARSAGAVRALLNALHELDHRCCIDAYVLEEARRNLAAKNVPEGLPWLDQALPRFEIAPIRPRDLTLEESLPLVEKDRPVLAAAIRAQCDYLVTGDRTRFGALFGTSVRGVKIVSPALLAEDLLLGDG